MVSSSFRNTNNKLTGISCKTQEIFLVVFCTRYLDLFTTFISPYNTFMKIFYISATALTIYLMRVRKPFCSTYDSLSDSFPHFITLLPAAIVLTVVCHIGTDWWELILSFSLWLEAVAFVPQIVMLNKIKEIENMTSHYIACLGLYRFFYILNW